MTEEFCEELGVDKYEDHGEVPQMDYLTRVWIGDEYKDIKIGVNIVLNLSPAEIRTMHLKQEIKIWKLEKELEQLKLNFFKNK